MGSWVSVKEVKVKSRNIWGIRKSRKKQGGSWSIYSQGTTMPLASVKGTLHLVTSYIRFFFR